jgi:hypothetical protein
MRGLREHWTERRAKCEKGDVCGKKSEVRKVNKIKFGVITPYSIPTHIPLIEQPMLWPENCLIELLRSRVFKQGEGQQFSRTTG